MYLPSQNQNNQNERPPKQPVSSEKNIFFKIIFLLTVGFMLIAPLLSTGFLVTLILMIGFNAVILLTIWHLRKNLRVLSLGLALVIPYVVFNLLSYAYSSMPYMATSKIFLCIFIVYAIVAIAKKVLQEPIIDTDLIFGSIVIYLLSGILFSRLYWLADILFPEATFRGLIPINLESGSIHDGIENQFNLLYYSFTTLTTLGIGDIAPTRYIGKALTITEAVFGQLFLATLIAKLVSIWPHKPSLKGSVAGESDIKRKASFVAIFIIVLMIVLVAPIILTGYFANLFLHICFNLLILFIIYTLGDHPLELWLGIIIAVPFLILDWLGIYYSSLYLMAISLMFLCVFLVYSIAFIAKKVLREPVVDTNLIFGAIMIYLLGGILWAKLYWLTDVFAYGSFTGTEKIDLNSGNIAGALRNQFDFFYYSFTTAASLGLGDIAPVYHVAKSLTVLEAIFGQLFVATTISKMVTVWRVRRT